MDYIIKKSIFIPLKRVMQPSAHEELQEQKRFARHERRMLTLSESRKDDIIKM